MCEGICIFAVVAYVLIIPVSFGPAGSARIERSVVLTNAAIMVVGELFVSDLVILLASRYSKKFKVDLASTWKLMDPALLSIMTGRIHE